jgi:hypothetical protein
MVSGVRPGSVGIYDIDMILESEGKIKAIFEYKRRKRRYASYYVPAFEYVGLQKLGRALGVTPYLIVETLEGGQTFHVFRLNLKEFSRAFIKWANNRTFAVFDNQECIEMDADDLREFMTKLTRGGA